VWRRLHREAIRRDDPQRAAWSTVLIGSGLMFRGEIAPGLGWFASTRPPGLGCLRECDAGGAAWPLLENREAAPDYALTGRFWQAPTLTSTSGRSRALSSEA
jgi:hypothetical protein